MSDMHLLSLAAIASILGVASHVFYFIRGEHHLQAYRLLLLSFTIPAVLFGFLLLRFRVSIVSAATVVTTTWWAYMASLWISMVVYRLCFHRLRAFDGPTLWKISKVFGHVMSVRKLDNFRVLDKLHRQYGDYVRTGVPPPKDSFVRAPISDSEKAQCNFPSLTLTLRMQYMALGPSVLRAYSTTATFLSQQYKKCAIESYTTNIEEGLGIPVSA